MTAAQAAQQQFDEKYISAREICESLEVSRSSITNAQKRGLLPDPIRLEIGDCHVCLWDRAEVTANLEAWRLMLQARRRQLKQGKVELPA